MKRLFKGHKFLRRLRKKYFLYLMQTFALNGSFKREGYTRLSIWLRRGIICTLIANLSFFNLVYAQLPSSTVLNLPAPGNKILTTEVFTPALITGLTIDLNNPLKLNFILDLGENNLDGKKLEVEAKKLIKYFLTALTVPEEELWVNLSPYEKNRIVPVKLGQTEMGQSLLAQDYLLKQLTASLVYPENELGKNFWNKVYDKALKTYGTTDIPMNTFNKVWIVPDKAVIYEKWPTAVVVYTHLKVMLEEDYVALQQNSNNKQMGTDGLKKSELENLNNLSSQIVRELIIPEIEKEVNEGKTFANLRQIYYSMILATWFKQKLRMSLLGQVYVDQNKIRGIDGADKEMKDKIYQQYIEAFRKGVFNYIKEDYDLMTNQMIPRKYMSGGWSTINPVDGLNLDQRVNAQVVKQYQNLSPSEQGSLSGGNKRLVGTVLLENTDESGIAQATNKGNENTGNIHFLFNNHFNFAQDIDRIKERIQWADIIIDEDHPLLEDIANSVSQGLIYPEQGFTDMRDLAQRNDIGWIFPEKRLAFLKAIYKSEKKIYAERIKQEGWDLYYQAGYSWKLFIHALVKGDTQRVREFYAMFLRQAGIGTHLREKTLIEQIHGLQQENSDAKILVIWGAMHTPPYVHLKREFPFAMITREFIGFDPVYTMYEAAQRDISFQAFELKDQTADLLTDAQVVMALAYEMLRPVNGHQDRLLLNKFSRRVNTMEQLQSFVGYISEHTPLQSLTDGSVTRWINKNFQDWLLMENIVTPQEIQEIEQSRFSTRSDILSPFSDKGIRMITKDKVNNDLGGVHFLFNKHNNFAQHLERIKEQIQWADSILFESSPLFEDVFNKVSRGQISPERGFQDMDELARSNGFKIIPQMHSAFLHAIYKTGKRIYVEHDVDEAVHYRRQADEAMDEFQGELLSGNAQGARQWYLRYIQSFGGSYYSRERNISEQIKAIQRQSPGSKTLVILGAEHTPPYVYFKKEFPGMNVTREFLGFDPIYLMNQAARRDISFQAFGLKSQNNGVLPDSQVIQAIAAHLLVYIPHENDDWFMVNKIAQRVNTMEQLERLAIYMRDHPPSQSLMDSSGVWSEEVVRKQVYKNFQDWLILEGIATREEIEETLGGDSSRKSAVSSTAKVRSNIEKNILNVLEHRDYAAEDLKSLDIDDLVILGNDQLETFRETLRLFQRGIGKRIYIAGGYGRLTLPLIDKAVDEGYSIRISEEQEVDSDTWHRVRSGVGEFDLRILIKQSEAQIIRQIMIAMMEHEGEFEDLKTRMAGKNIEDVFWVEKPQDKPENNSKNTIENIILYKKFLTEEGSLPNGQAFKSLYIQTPHQQLRSKATFDHVFSEEISNNQIHGVSYTISYQDNGRNQEQVVKDLVGELWRLIVYSEKGALRLQNSTYPDGITSLPKDLWIEGLELFHQLNQTERIKFASDLLKLIIGLGIDLGKLSQNIPDEVKKFIAEIVAVAGEQVVDDYNQKKIAFENELVETANREGIVITPDTKIGLFIGGPHIVGGYYYKLFDDVVRKEFGADLVYLPFPITEGDQERVKLVKERLKNDPQLVGAVVTRPWKEEFSDVQSRIGAVNFIVKTKSGQLHASATDGQAWINGLNHDLGYQYYFKEKEIVIIGSGGAAREIAEALNNKSLKKITFSDIDRSKLKSLKEMIARLNVDYEVDFLDSAGSELNDAIKEADIVVNATGIGREKTKGKSPLEDHSAFRSGQIVSDLISNEYTQILIEAENRGVEHALYGRSMFIDGMVGFMEGWLAQTGEGPGPSKSELFGAISDWLEVHNAASSKPMSDKVELSGRNKELKYGGINFNPRFLDLQIKRDDEGIPVPLNQQPLNRIHIEGFIPIIVNIQSIPDLPLMLGINKQETFQRSSQLN